MVNLIPFTAIVHSNVKDNGSNITLSDDEVLRREVNVHLNSTEDKHSHENLFVDSSEVSLESESGCQNNSLCVDKDGPNNESYLPETANVESENTHRNER